MPTDSRVRYGPAPDRLLWVAGDTALTTEHEVLLSDLVGDATYFYSVGTTGQILAGGNSDHFFVTPPAAGSGRPTRIWVTADAGAADASGATVGDAYRRFTGALATDMWLRLGSDAEAARSESPAQNGLFDAYPDLVGHAHHATVSTTPSMPTCRSTRRDRAGTRPNDLVGSTPPATVKRGGVVSILV